MSVVDYWKNKIAVELTPRIKALSGAELHFYECVLRPENSDIKAKEEAVSRCKPALKENQIQKVWDILCIKENFENNMRVAELRENDPQQFEAFSRFKAGEE